MPPGRPLDASGESLVTFNTRINNYR